MKTIKELRKMNKLTQKEASEITKVPLRTFVCYENNPEKRDSIKYRYICRELYEYGYIDEAHGILELEDIILKCKEIISEYKINYAILYGPYASGTATEKSEIKILLSPKRKGAAFYGIGEKLRFSLKKKVKILDYDSFKNNIREQKEILKYGIRI